MDIYTSALVLAWIAILLLAFAMAGLLRQVHLLTVGRSPAPRMGPAVGDVAPSWAEFGSPPVRDTVALFVDVGCGSCERVLRAADQIAADSELDFIAFFPGRANGYQPSRLALVEEAGSVFDRYRVSATPFGVVVNGEGRIAGAAPLGSDQALSELVNQPLIAGGSSGNQDR